MNFSYETTGAISISKTITKIFLGFEYCSSGKVSTCGVSATTKKVYKKIVKEIIHKVYTNKYKFIASGTSSAGGLARKIINKINIKTSGVPICALEVFLF